MVAGETIYETAGKGRTTSAVNLRRKPDGRRLMEMEAEEDLLITGEVMDGGELWYHIKTERGQKGYVLGKFVRVLQPAVLIPVDESIVREKFPIVQCDPIHAINASEPFEYTEEELAQYNTLTAGAFLSR